MYILSRDRTGFGPGAARNFAGFEQRLETALGRMEKDEILSAFAIKAVTLLVQQGKDAFLPGIQISVLIL